MIRDLLLSIALYGAAAIGLERWAALNSWLYGFLINQLER
jgi:hypothetical protein